MALKKPIVGQKLIVSFKNAYQGVKYAFRERNFRIQLCLGIVAVALGLAFNISREEMLIILLLIASVLFAETVNSAGEGILDLFAKTYQPEVGWIKDVLAGGVLIYSIVALIVGIIIFGHAIALF